MWFWCLVQTLSDHFSWKNGFHILSKCQPKTDVYLHQKPILADFNLTPTFGTLRSNLSSSSHNFMLSGKTVIQKQCSRQKHCTQKHVHRYIDIVVTVDFIKNYASVKFHHWKIYNQSNFFRTFNVHIHYPVESACSQRRGKAAPYPPVGGSRPFVGAPQCILY